MNAKSILRLLESEIKFVVEEQARILIDIESLDSRLRSLQEAAEQIRDEILCNVPE